MLLMSTWTHLIFLLESNKLEMLYHNFLSKCTKREQFKTHKGRLSFFLEVTSTPEQEEVIKFRVYLKYLTNLYNLEDGTLEFMI